MSDQPSIPILLTPEQHLTWVAAILAHGIMRLRHVAENHPPRDLGDSRLQDLEVVSESRLCGSNNRPVTHISWFGAKAFCEWLSKKEGRVYRLPTEAEWEYMVRAGTSTAYPWGDEWSEGKANVGSSGMQEVGRYAPNGWGVFDSVGNV